MIKPITDDQLAQLDKWYEGYPSGDTAEPKEDFDSVAGMLYGAIRERLRLAEAVVEAAETVMDQQTDLSTIGRCGGDDPWHWCEPEAQALWDALTKCLQPAATEVKK